MEIEGRKIGEVLLLIVREPRIDAASAIRFKDEMRRLTEGHAGRVVLDLGMVAFLDSSGLGAVVSAMKQLGSDRRLELAALTPTVAKVFRLTRLDTVFTIHARAEDMLAGLAAAS